MTRQNDNPGDMDANQAAALSRVEKLRDRTVPDPGELYWAGFTRRVHLRLPSPARRWVPWAGMAAAAASLMLVMWIGGRTISPSPTTGDSDQGLAILATWEEERVDGALDQILGETGADLLAAEIPALTLAAKQDLLDSLREELSQAGAPSAPGLNPSPGPA
ncbi:MAG: hypothetical protein O7F11_06345 [Acidobacteria bacterium]|nr:hypothetical protein [Acidobacteriota bacterium]